MAKVFVYGTLKKGRYNHGYLREAKYVGEYHTNNEYTLLVKGFPYLVARNGQGCRGELYEVSKDLLRLLDTVEGHPDFYTRTRILVYDIETGVPVTAEVYLHADIFTPRDYETKTTRSF